MHIFYLQALEPELLEISREFYHGFRVVAISTPSLPKTPKLGEIICSEDVINIVANGFQVVLQPKVGAIERHKATGFFRDGPREIHIAPGYRVKRDTIPHQILTQPEPVQKTDKQPDKVETLRRPWWHFGIW